MLSTLPQKLGKTVVVLGAGATRGSTLADGTERPLPPLDADFFTQVQRIKHEKHQPYIDALLSFCFNEFGPGWSLSMERFFNHIWYAKRFRPHLNVKVDTPSKIRSVSVESVFRQVLLATLEQSLFDSHSHSCLTKRCDIHDSLAQHLRPGDAVISFNYDCLADASLREYCPYWDANRSYGFAPRKESATTYWQSTKPYTGRDFVPLLKLHGSINWQRSGTRSPIGLVQRPYTRQNGDRDFFIVPPVLSKDDEIRGVLWPLWKQAYSHLAKADTVFVIGYSLPSADALAQALFYSRSAYKKGSALKYLVLANPDRSTRHHLIQVFRRSIDDSTRVLVFDKMADAVTYLVTGENGLQ